MEEFFKYWDKVLSHWVEHGTYHPNEEYWFEANHELYEVLMPEPYYGDPTNCSAVIMNYNPGVPDYKISTEEGYDSLSKDITHHSRIDDSESMCYHYARNYREAVKTGGYVGADLNKMYQTRLSFAGKCWWSKRLHWVKELIPESNKNPFALELCAWHSHSWKVSYSKKLVKKINELMGSMIEEAVKNSDLGVGICVGSAWGKVILPKMGYQDVTAEVMKLTLDQDGWHPLGCNRAYRILRSKNGIFILNTWKSKGHGSMDVPESKFREKEKEMINQITLFSGSNPNF